ncbi:MMPL family transporter [Peterkaempfera bronchialis]|uniref:MMPL family transporter n=1 Tax=Peterkaempfera bronchialis TaxID=2126346 RepID=UPI0013B43C7D|nr:MMPL family transporter [Peterkaempfera bronchialis]
MFTQLGRFDVVRRAWVLAGAAVVLAVAGWACSGLQDRLSYGGFIAPDAEASRAAEAIRTQIGEGGADVLVTFRSRTLPVSDPAFRHGVEAALRGAPAGSVARATTYWSTGIPMLVSLDGHATVAAVLLGGDDEPARTRSYLALRRDVRADGFEVGWTGPTAVITEIVERSRHDLLRTELLALPLMALLLVVVFRGVVAALLPLVTGVLATAASLTALSSVAGFVEVPFVTVNLVVAIGLAAGVDAGLLIVSRFREELRAGREVPDAVVVTVDTAGRTVLLSGTITSVIAVGLTFFPLGFVRSFGIGATVGLLAGSLVTVTVLPALLACLGHRVNAWALPRPWCAGPVGGGRGTGWARTGWARTGWARTARAVMEQPLRYALAVSALLLALAVPFLHTVIGFPDERMLPPGAGARTAAEELRGDFAVSGLGAIQAVATFDAPLTGRTGHEALLAWTRRLAELDGAHGVLVAGTSQQSAVVYLGHEGGAESDSAKALVRAVRAQPLPGGGRVLVGGATALALDTMDRFWELLPRVLLFMAGSSFALLTVALRSLVLPVKALLMNVLSIGASFGALTWIFQDGHGSGLLGVRPTGYVDALAPIVMLFLLIAVSMDYELFLLLRIREQYRRLGDNEEAIALGLQLSGGVITAAASAVLVVAAVFATSEVVLVKEICVGIFIAVALDAALVRAVLVPATMRLLGRANWWLPSLPDRLRRPQAVAAVRAGAPGGAEASRVSSPAPPGPSAEGQPQ